MLFDSVQVRDIGPSETRFNMYARLISIHQSTETKRRCDNKRWGPLAVISSSLPVELEEIERRTEGAWGELQASRGRGCQVVRNHFPYVSSIGGHHKDITILLYENQRWGGQVFPPKKTWETNPKMLGSQVFMKTCIPGLS